MAVAVAVAVAVAFMSAPAALAVFAVFVALDLSRFAISRAHGTDEVWTLQQDIRALRASLATATSPRSLAFAERRERLLHHKERRLAHRQTDPALRRALFVSHYVSVAKALVGCAFAFLMTKARFYPFASDDFDRLIDGAPAFVVQRAAVGSIGRWLAFPHALEWEAGAIGVVPWLALSASASVAAARGVAGPILCFFGLMPNERERRDFRQESAVSKKRA